MMLNPAAMPLHNPPNLVEIVLGGNTTIASPVGPSESSVPA